MLELLAPRKRFLDGRADVAAAYSLRRLRSAYGGPLIRLRESGGSKEADFGVGQGGVDWGTVASFIGAGSGFVAKWYDQSGNGRDLAQGTASAQPQIGLLSNGLPGLIFDGVEDHLKTAAFTLDQPWSFDFCHRQVTTSKPDFENKFDGFLADTGTLYRRTSSLLFDNGLWAGNQGPNSAGSSSMPVGTRGVAGGTFNNTAALLEIDAADVAGFAGTVGTNNPGGLTLGTKGDAAAARFTNMEVQEWVVFNTAHGSAQLKADNAAMRRAWRF